MEVYAIICPELGWDNIVSLHLSLKSLSEKIEELLDVSEESLSKYSFNELQEELKSKKMNMLYTKYTQTNG